jgi:hypothetical protein
VFDAAGGPMGTSQETTLQGLDIVFAAEEGAADSWIERQVSVSTFVSFSIRGIGYIFNVFMFYIFYSEYYHRILGDTFVSNMKLNAFLASLSVFSNSGASTQRPGLWQGRGSYIG